MIGMDHAEQDFNNTLQKIVDLLLMHIYDYLSKGQLIIILTFPSSENFRLNLL